MKIYILGTGAVGLPLAAYLTHHGREVVAVRTRESSADATPIAVTVRHGHEPDLQVSVETASLAMLPRLDGILVVTVKAYANPTLAARLAERAAAGPLVIMQNGLGVETPFLDAGFPEVCRCVLYMSSQVAPNHIVTFRQIASSPIGSIAGPAGRVEDYVAALTTPQFQFHAIADIQRQAWKKTILNAVFNSLCPLLEIDNGVFVRDAEVRNLAAEIVDECVALAAAMGVRLTATEIMEQTLKISAGSQGVLISTLQDINHGRETEMPALNLEMARLAAALSPPLPFIKTELLGRMILEKSRLRRCGQAQVWKSSRRR